jgi:hypothetical protein
MKQSTIHVAISILVFSCILIVESFGQSSLAPVDTFNLSPEINRLRDGIALLQTERMAVQSAQPSRTMLSAPEATQQEKLFLKFYDAK